MRFVFASYVVTPYPGDPEAWLSRIKAYTGMLEELGKTDEVISIEQIGYEGQLTKNRVNYLFKQFSSHKYFPFNQNNFIRQLKPDVVVIQSLHFPLHVIQLRIALGPDVKIIVQNHAEQPFMGLKRYVQRWADKCINAYFFASKELGMEWAARGRMISRDKIYEVMEVSSEFYPVNRKHALTKTGISPSENYLWVGRLNENKDPLNVVKASLAFVDHYPSARLFMLYQTEELLPQIKTLLKNHPNADNIILIGKIPHDEMLDWYNSADFIVSGSHYEGSGTAVCEAMSCGCIPVITDIHSFRSMTNNGKTGILYQPGNEKELLAALFRSQQIDLEVCRKNVLSFFHENLSFKAIANKFHAIASSL